MPFTFERFDQNGPILIKPRVFHDSRGYFLESYKKSDFAQLGMDMEFVQDNYSLSRRGVLRGLHFQTGAAAQAKLVLCLSGRVWDVAVDIRPHSPGFGTWRHFELSDDNPTMLFLPAGYAHGFYALQDSLVVYKTSREYQPEAERGIIWNDPELNITWPLTAPPVLSDKDILHPLLSKAAL